jgi:hypothetical protein
VVLLIIWRCHGSRSNRTTTNGTHTRALYVRPSSPAISRLTWVRLASVPLSPTTVGSAGGRRCRGDSASQSRPAISSRAPAHSTSHARLISLRPVGSTSTHRARPRATPRPPSSCVQAHPGGRSLSRTATNRLLSTRARAGPGGAGQSSADRDLCTAHCGRAVEKEPRISPRATERIEPSTHRMGSAESARTFARRWRAAHDCRHRVANGLGPTPMRTRHSRSLTLAGPSTVHPGSFAVASPASGYLAPGGW